MENTYSGENSVIGEGWVSGETVPRRYAGFWIRFLAVILDGIIMNIVGYVLKLATGTTRGDTPLWVSLLSLLISLAYYVILTAKYGQTLGKMVVGIQVIRQDGGPVSFGTALLREVVGKFVSGLILGIGYLMVAFDPEKRGLHDRIASTYVVWRK